MTDKAAVLATASRNCKIIAVAAALFGTLAFLIDGGSGFVAELARPLLRLTWADLAGIAIVVGTAAVGSAYIVFGEVVLVIVGVVVVLAVGGCALLLVFGATAIGWGRIVGLTILDTSPAFGSPVGGVGALIAASALVALACCLTPLTIPFAGGRSEAGFTSPIGDAGRGDPKGQGCRPASAYSRKVGVGLAAGFALIIVPGWIAASSGPHDRPNPRPETISGFRFNELVGPTSRTTSAADTPDLSR